MSSLKRKGTDLDNKAKRNLFENVSVEKNTITSDGINAKNLKFEKLLAVTDQYDGCLTFLVKFKDNNQPMFVEAAICNLAVPQMVIAFYEKHIVFEE